MQKGNNLEGNVKIQCVCVLAATFIAASTGICSTNDSVIEPFQWTTTHSVLFKSKGGDFYGSTPNSVFKMSSNGVITTLHTFDGTDGSNISGGLIEASDGYFYGTARYGGAYGHGTIFKVNPQGDFKLLTSLSTDGPYYPSGPLLEGADGNFYGISDRALTSNDADGAVFKMDRSGNVNVILKLDFDTTGRSAGNGFIYGPDGWLYAPISEGGINHVGSILKFSTSGDYSVIPFDTNHGIWPAAPLIIAKDGNMYGTTLGFGSSQPPMSDTNGTIFKLTPSGELTTLAWFNGSNGANPSGGVIQASDGNFYGTTTSGGAYGYGTVFMFSTNIGIVTLYSFGALGTYTINDSWTYYIFSNDGESPYGTLLPSSDGTLYGSLFSGGPTAFGGIFHLLLPNYRHFDTIQSKQGGLIELGLRVSSTQTNILQSTTDLKTWNDILTYPPTNGTFNIIQTNAESSKFYRIMTK